MAKTRARRGRGEGSVSFHTPSGLWRARTPAPGRKTFYGKTKAEALAKLRGHKPAAVEPSRMTLEEFLRSWLDGAAKLTVGTAALKRYRHCVELRIVPAIGSVPLAKLTAWHVQELYKRMSDEGVSPRCQQMTANVLIPALRHAVALKLMIHNPALDVPRPRCPKKEMKVWNAEQAKAFLAAARSDRLHALYVLALSTGMREGELFGLQWGDVDLAAGYLTVQRTLEELSGKLTLKEPKTAAARRRIDLPRVAVDAMIAHRAAMLREGNAAAPAVFCDRRGGFLRQGNVARRSFVPLSDAAGLPRIRFHDLRHTAATLMLAAGVPAKVVSERLGHASVEITLSVYAHILPTMQAAAVRAIDAALA
jgi:integrase